MTIQRPHVISCRLSTNEWRELTFICQKYNVTIYDMLRALIKDAIADEAEDVRRIESEGREDRTKASEGCGASA